MIVARISALIFGQSVCSDLVIVMKSRPKKIASTPAISKSCKARGEEVTACF